MISAAFVYAQAGLERAFADAGRAAKTLVSSFAANEEQEAEPTLRDDQVVRAIIDLNRAKNSVKANAAVLDADQKMTGTLLDILA